MVSKQSNVYEVSGKGLATGQCLFSGCPQSPGWLWMLSWGQRCPGSIEIPTRLPRPPGLLAPLLPARWQLREDAGRWVSVALSLRKSALVSGPPTGAEKGAVTHPDPLLGASLVSVPLPGGHRVSPQPPEPSATASVELPGVKRKFRPSNQRPWQSWGFSLALLARCYSNTCP